jgi:tetratricopeptide (TPR) repeat protein
MKKILFSVVGLLLMQQAAYNQDTIRVTIAPQIRMAAQPQDPYNLLPRLRAMLREQEGVAWLPMDTVAVALGAPLDGSFYLDYEPVHLYQAKQQLNLDVVLCYQADLTHDTLTVQLEMKSFPHGISLARNELALAQKRPVPQQNQLLRQALEKLLLQVMERRETFGFACNDHDKGMVVLTASLKDSVYREAVIHFLEQLDLNADEPTLLQIVETDSMPVRCEEMARVASSRNARLVLGLNSVADSIWSSLYIRPEPCGMPIKDWALPIHADAGSLLCDRLAGDDQFLSYVNAALFQNESDGREFLVKADLVQKQRRLLENHIPLWYAWAVTAGKRNGLSEAPAWLGPLYETLIAAAERDAQKAWLWLNYASLQEHGALVEPALSSFKQADTLFVNEREFRGAGLARWHRALLFEKQKDHPAGRREWARAVQAFQIAGDSVSMAAAMKNIAVLFELDRQSAEARAVYMKTAEVYELLHEPFEAAQIYDHLGLAARSGDDSREAMKQFEAYLLAAQKMHSEPALARAHFQIGLTYFQDHQLLSALESFNKAMDLFELLGDQSGMARTDINLGQIKQQQGLLDEARSHYLAALHAAESKQDTATVIVCNTNLAELAILTKTWDEVQNRYDQALATARLLQNKNEQAEILYAKGLAHLKEGRLKTGYLELQQALELGGGAVRSDADTEKAFMKKLETLIGDIEGIKGSSYQP